MYAAPGNLAAHGSRDVPLSNPAYPRWGFVFRPVAAAYPNLVGPRWQVLRSLALKGRRFETWGQVAAAVEKATAYWNAHRHPFVWGRRRRHRPRRSGGFAAPPPVR